MPNAGAEGGCALASVLREELESFSDVEIVAVDQAQSSMKKMGTSYFTLVDPATAVKPASNAEVHQGMLEQSNVPVSDSAVRMISIMRQFEMLQKAISVDADMDRRAIDEVAKVSS